MKLIDDRDTFTLINPSHEIQDEYGLVRPLIKRGCLISLNSPLRKSLNELARAMQGVLNDGEHLTLFGVAVLCANETKTIFKRKRHWTYEEKENYAHTLFFYSCLCLSETGTRH